MGCSAARFLEPGSFTIPAMKGAWPHQKPVNIGVGSLSMPSSLGPRRRPQSRKPNKTGVLYRFLLRALFRLPISLCTPLYSVFANIVTSELCLLHRPDFQL